MRLYVLPLTARRTLLHAQRLTPPPTTLTTRLADRAAKTWTSWTLQKTGWQAHCATYGNKLLRHIALEEWSLKSIPPMTAAQKAAVAAREKPGAPVEVVYPEGQIQAADVPVVLEKLATEREGLHRRRLFWCFVGMPIAVPFAIVPVIPNLPLFYLMYRAYSHWTAILGGKHLQHLLSNNLLTYKASAQLAASYKSPAPNTPNALLLTDSAVSEITSATGIPEIQVDLDRAVGQITGAVDKEAEVATKNPVEAQEAVAEKSDSAREEEHRVRKRHVVKEDKKKIHSYRGEKENTHSHHGEKEKKFKHHKDNHTNKAEYREKEKLKMHS